MVIISLVYAMLICCFHSQAIPTTTASLSCSNGEYTSIVDLNEGNWWFKLDLSSTQTIHFSNCNSTFDTMMAVYNESMNVISFLYCDGWVDDCGSCSWNHSVNEQFTIPNLSAGIHIDL
eukprot:316953_1